MIELYDSARLTVKHDRTLAIAAGVLLVTGGLMAAYTALLHVQLQGTLARTEELQGRLAGLGQKPGGEAGKATPSPRAALVADLQLQAEQLEREAAQAGLPATTASGAPADSTPKPSEWMVVLGALTQAETSLHKVDIERSGNVRIEGLATNPQALNALVQTWQQQDAVAFVQARSMEVKQEKLPAPFLRFQLNGTPVPTPAGAKAVRTSGSTSASTSASAAGNGAQP